MDSVLIALWWCGRDGSLEYHLSTTGHEPTLFVVRKMYMEAEREPECLAEYYILHGAIYQAPDLFTLCTSRLVRPGVALSASPRSYEGYGFVAAKLCSLLEAGPRGTRRPFPVFSLPGTHLEVSSVSQPRRDVW